MTSCMTKSRWFCLSLGFTNICRSVHSSNKHLLNAKHRLGLGCSWHIQGDQDSQIWGATTGKSYQIFVGKRKTQISSVQLLSCLWLFATPWIAACQASLSITNSQSLLKLICIESMMPSGHLILCRPLLLLSPIPPSIRVFSNESTLHMRWPKYWSFSFSIIPSKEIPGLISFRMDWLDLLAVQETLKSLLQPQFKSINSLELSLLHSPTLTSIHD